MALAVAILLCVIFWCYKCGTHGNVGFSRTQEMWVFLELRKFGFGTLEILVLPELGKCGYNRNSGNVGFFRNSGDVFFPELRKCFFSGTQEMWVFPELRKCGFFQNSGNVGFSQLIQGIQTN